MALVLHHHPRSRAANVVWMLEEAGVPYTLHPVDLSAGHQKSAAHRALNGMGKIPVLVDDGVAISEAAAIGLYLADRYAPGRLAPAPDDPARGPFLRWCFWSPSVMEPAAAAAAFGWAGRPGALGWGSAPEMLDTLEAGLPPGPFLLGPRFSMADCILGGTLRFLLAFKMIEARPAFRAYADRLAARPAAQRAAAVNAAAGA